MRLLAIILLPAAVAACSKPTVDSNVRMPGEPSTVARQLTSDERREAVSAIASAQPTGFEPRPLTTAGEHGRWSEVPKVAVVAVKSCEVAVVVQREVPGGLEFDLRAINDERGVMRVMGGEAEGVTGVQAQMGLFGRDRALADRIVKAFERELRVHGRIPRPQ